MMFAKQKPWRSKKYLTWLVKNLPCCVCGARADHAHHIIGVGHYGGMGTKAPDSLAMPVCCRHHDEIHRDPNIWPDQFQWVMETLQKALEERAPT